MCVQTGQRERDHMGHLHGISCVQVRWPGHSEDGSELGPPPDLKGWGGLEAPTSRPQVCVQDKWGSGVPPRAILPTAPPTPRGLSRVQIIVTASEQLCEESCCHCSRLTEKKTEVCRGEVYHLERAQPRHEPRTVPLRPVGPPVPSFRSLLWVWGS